MNNFFIIIVKLCQNLMIIEHKFSDNLVIIVLDDKELVEKGMYTLWMLWNNRNNCIHNLACRNSSALTVMIETMVKEFWAEVSSPITAGQRFQPEWQGRSHWLAAPRCN